MGLFIQQANSYVTSVSDNEYSDEYEGVNFIPNELYTVAIDAW
jgi:hypothetical protein